MCFKNNFKLYTIFFVLFFVLFYSVSFSENLSSLTGVRYSKTAEKVRIVFEFSDKVDCHFSSISFPEPAINAVITGAQISPSVKSKIKESSDNLFLGLSLSKRGCRSISVDIDLNYPISKDKVKLISLNDSGKNRIVFDLYRDFSIKYKTKISNDITLNTEESANSNGYLIFNDLSVKAFPKGQAYFDISMASGAKGREKVTDARKRNACIAAINGGFFAWEGGTPLGLVYRYGKLIAPHVSRRPPRTCFGILMDGTPVIDKITAKSGNVFKSDGNTLNNVAFVLGGGPNLVSNGCTKMTADEEGLGKGGNDITHRAGRTAVGTDYSGNIHLFTATGFNDSHSEGMKLIDFASKLSSNGIVNAMNFDGGGSSAMDILGMDVSKPVGVSRYERPVGNFLCLYSKEKMLAPYVIKLLNSDKKDIKADGADSASISISVSYADGTPVEDGTCVKIIPSFGEFPFFVKTSSGKADFKIGNTKKCGNFYVFAVCGLSAEKIFNGRFVASKPSYFEMTSSYKKMANADNYKVDFTSEDEYGNRITEGKFKFVIYDEDNTSELYSNELNLPATGSMSFYVDKEFAGKTVSALNESGEVVATCLLVKPLEVKPIEIKPVDSENGENKDDKNGDNKIENKDDNLDKENKDNENIDNKEDNVDKNKDDKKDDSKDSEDSDESDIE